MIIYHGSNINIKEIDLSKCSPNKDFGQGFYLTGIEKHATRMAKRVVRFRGRHLVLNKYNFDEVNLSLGILKVKILDRPTEEWASFVMNNRNMNHKQPIMIL